MSRSDGRPELCRYYAKTKTCKFGDGCRYSHDLSQTPWRVSKPAKLICDEKSNEERFVEAVRFVKAAMASPTLGGFGTEALFFSVPTNFNWRWFVYGRGTLQSTFQKKQFVDAVLYSMSQDSSEVIQQFGRKNLMHMKAIYNALLDPELSQDEFLRIIPVLMAIFTHSALVNSSYIAESNSIYSSLLSQLDYLLDEVPARAGDAVNDGWPTMAGKNEILVLCLGQLLVPYLELLHVLITRFHNARYHAKFGAAIRELDRVIRKWQDSIRIMYPHDPVESGFVVKICERSFKRLAVLGGIVENELSLGKARLAKESADSSKKSISYWSSEPCPPGGFGRRPRHDNDFFDFREIRVVPTMREVLCIEAPALPGNHLFDTQAHWLTPGFERHLDTNFRLLREDFMASFRVSMQGLYEALSKRKGFIMDGQFRRHDNANNVFIYRNAKIDNVAADSSFGVLIRISFDIPGKIKKIMDRRLESGTLICLVWQKMDGAFDMFFGISATIPREYRDTNKNETTRGSVWFSMVDDIPGGLLGGRNENSSKCHYLVEANLMFETYRAVLCSLQAKDITDLPFQRYICPTEEARGPGLCVVEPPIYALAPGFTFNLSFLVNEGDLFLSVQDENSRTECVEVLCGKSSLDRSQATALVGALSSEFSCIQGPPGTGKTFTGEKIAMSLLQSNQLGPILIVCFTNHALDQFLGRLIRNGIIKIKRIGGQSKDEMISKFVLSNSEVRPRSSCLFTLRSKLNEHIELFKARQQKMESVGWKEKLVLLQAYHPSLYSSFLRYDDDFGDFYFVGMNGQKVTSYRHWLKSGASSCSSRPLEVLLNSDDVWSMNDRERRSLDSYLKQSIQDENESELNRIAKTIRNCREEINDIYNAEKASILQKQQVIGITTTGAAKYFNILKRVNYRVLICEEASEILESHSIAALTSSVEHMISLGDHKQLRPHIQEFSLSMESESGKKYSLDLSLFERLQLPEYRLPLYSLSEQRRMRPEISRLVRETIYPGLLKDHVSVKTYGNVRGTKFSTFFLDHDHAEDDDHSISRSNLYEARFIVAITRHLLNQGYNPSQITVLTPYTGQLLLIRKEMSGKMATFISEPDLNDISTEMVEDDAAIQKSVVQEDLRKCIRVSTVDNYQGEENDIVIVSLVRNSGPRVEAFNMGSIGFLKIPNRNNVLLSRAKIGMFLIGQASLLARQSEMWNTILEMMMKDDFVGPTFRILCENHQDWEREIGSPEMFEVLSPNGGCNLPCRIKLPKCGHACPLACHYDSSFHTMVFCTKPCQRHHSICDHPCPKLCGEKCGECEFDVGVTKLECGHSIQHTPCYVFEDLSSWTCKDPVAKVVQACGHTQVEPCSVEESDIKCQAICSANLDCGHKCTARCFECIESSEEHVRCRKVCDRPFACGHRCKQRCHTGECSPCSQKCEIFACQHSSCNHLCSENCSPCNEPCQWNCTHEGQCPLPCGAPCLRLPCDQRCNLKLSCGHQCPSVCGEICPDYKFCPVCAEDDIKDIVVDMIMFKQYREIDLDTTPIISLTCDHLMTAESLDGLVDLKRFYSSNEHGIWSLVESPDLSLGSDVQMPACPTCRKPIRHIRRFGRAVRSAMLLLAEKRYISRSRELIIQCSRYLEANSLDPKMKMIIENAIEFVESPPTKIIHDSSRNMLREQGKEDLCKYLNIPRTQYHLSAEMYVLVHRLENQDFQRRMGKKYVSDVSMKFLARIAKKQLSIVNHLSDEKLKNELIFEQLFAKKLMIMYLARQLSRSGGTCECSKLIDSAESVLKKLRNLAETGCITFLKASGNRLTNCIKSLDGYVRTGDFGSFYEPLSDEEKKCVYEAMNMMQHVAWYSCPNGHIYTIGECGMAMQQGLCPECHATIGGRHHQPAPGNVRASSLV